MNYHPIYEEILESLDRDLEIESLQIGSSWVAAKLDNGNCGIAAKLYDHATASVEDLLKKNRKIHLLAEELLQQDPYKAAIALSAINASFNSVEIIRNHHAIVDPNMACVHGMDLAGKIVAVIGHMSRTRDQILREFQPQTVYMFDMDPSRGDLPVEQEPDLLPQCDAVVITGTALINHTIGEILQWSPDASHILTGPSVPFIPHMTSVSQISGMAVSKADAFLSWNAANAGSPLPYCETFLLKTPFKGG